MEKTYNLNELAMISSFTTRSLRMFLKEGLLEGEKIDGVWRFTEEEIEAFLSQSAVRKSMQSKHNTLVLDFLLNTMKRENQTCVILDLAVSGMEAMEINSFFCDRISEAHGVEYRFNCHRDLTRVVLSGAEDQVSAIMKAYYEGR